MPNSIQSVVTLSGGMDSTVCAALAVREKARRTSPPCTSPMASAPKPASSAPSPKSATASAFAPSHGAQPGPQPDRAAPPSPTPRLRSPPPGRRSVRRFPSPTCPSATLTFSPWPSVGQRFWAPRHLHWSRCPGQLRLSRLPSRVLRGLQSPHPGRYQRGQIRIHTPLIALKKVEIVRLGLELGCALRANMVVLQPGRSCLRHL